MSQAISIAVNLSSAIFFQLEECEDFEQRKAIRAKLQDVLKQQRGMWPFELNFFLNWSFNEVTKSSVFVLKFWYLSAEAGAKRLEELEDDMYRRVGQKKQGSQKNALPLVI